MPPGGASGGSLADLTVNFVLKGKEDVQAGVQQIQEGIAAFASAVQQLGAQMVAAMQSAATAAQKAGGMAAPLAAAFNQAAGQMQAALGTFGTAIAGVTAKISAGLKQATQQMHQAAGQAVQLGTAAQEGGGQAQGEFGALGAAVAAVTARISAGMQQLGVWLKQTAKGAQDLGESFRKAADAINVALGTGIGVIANFVRQGLAASNMGQVLSFQMERLALTIAGMFRPELEKVLDGINRLTDWINSLTDAQKKSIAHWIEAGAAALAVGLVLPRIVAGVRAVIGAVTALGAAIAGLEVSTGIGAILPILGLLAEGITVLMTSTESGRAALGELWESLKELGSAALDLARALHLDEVWAGMVEGVKIVIGVVAQLVRWIADLVKWLDKISSGIIGKAISWGITALMGPLAVLGRLKAELNPEVKKQEAPGSRDTLLRRTGGFEDLRSAYQRIAVAALRASSGMKTPEQRTAEAAERSEKHLANIDRHTAEKTPLLAR